MLMAHAHATQVFQLKTLVLVLVLVFLELSCWLKHYLRSLSMVSLPAPESVVDSFPVKTQGKSVRSQPEDDVTQCYICLVEYEEGDKIRVLPCRHEYHISCIDKWLKEIHGVCLLCQGDVSCLRMFHRDLCFQLRWCCHSLRKNIGMRHSLGTS